MALYQKVDGVWVEADRPYVLRNGVWTAAKGAFVKRSGVWVQAYEYDVTPPNPPELTLNIVEDFDTTGSTKQLVSRWIRVGVRLPGSANDPDARLARVLTTYAGKPPTTPLGGTYTSGADKTYPKEAWSNWEYNSYGVHKDTSVYAYKQWPLNASAGVIIPGDRDYHFGGWSLDRNGNWSVATQHVIHVPKASVDAANVIVKEARFQPNNSGSWRSTGYQSGILRQQASPFSRGLWFYGNQFTDSIGKHGTPTVRSAQIKIDRLDDTGVANANIYLFWTGYGAPGDLPAPGANLVRHETTKLGTLAKGQGKWFDLPVAFRNNLNTDLKGLGLDNKDPIKAAPFPEDFSEVQTSDVNLRCGEVHIVWEEKL